MVSGSISTKLRAFRNPDDFVEAAVADSDMRYEELDYREKLERRIRVQKSAAVAVTGGLDERLERNTASVPAEAIVDVLWTLISPHRTPGELSAWFETSRTELEFRSPLESIISGDVNAVIKLALAELG